MYTITVSRNGVQSEISCLTRAELRAELRTIIGAIPPGFGRKTAFIKHRWGGCEYFGTADDIASALSCVSNAWGRVTFVSITGSDDTIEIRWGRKP